MDRPLKDRMIGPRVARGLADREIVSLHHRPSHYKNWSENNIHKAYQAHLNGISLRMAAELYGVPRSTLADRASGKVPFGARSGPSTYLTDVEEVEFVNFLVHCASVGYAKSKQEVLAIVRNVL